jgi:hypothetical protein
MNQIMALLGGPSTPASQPAAQQPPAPPQWQTWPQWQQQQADEQQSEVQQAGAGTATEAAPWTDPQGISPAQQQDFRFYQAYTGSTTAPAAATSP